jgi:regulator of sigma E protease
MTTIGAFIIVLGVIVMVHELGHFFAARSVGVRVDRFSIGFPPRLITITSVPGGFEFRLFFYRKDQESKIAWGPVKSWRINKSGREGSGTEYCLAIIPLGGYVKMAGMIDESLDGTIEYKPDELMSKPVWAQIWVMSAGVIMNILLAFIIFTGVAWNHGTPSVNNEPVIHTLVDDMPAKDEGLLPGDRIVSINKVPISTWNELSQTIHAIPNTPITLTFQRGNIEYQKSLTTNFQIQHVDGRLDTLGAIGIKPKIIFQPIGFFEATQIGVVSTIRGFGLIVLSIKMLVSGEASVSDLGGPILIAQLAGEWARAGWISLLTFMALISCNLAFINFLPIPGLDGGHVFILLAESLLGRKFTIKTRMVIQQIGMALLLLLMVTVMINDIVRLFTN